MLRSAGYKSRTFCSRRTITESYGAPMAARQLGSRIRVVSVGVSLLALAASGMTVLPAATASNQAGAATAPAASPPKVSGVDVPIPSVPVQGKTSPADPAAKSATIPQQTLPLPAVVSAISAQGTAPSAVTSTSVTAVPATGWVPGPDNSLSLGAPAQGAAPLSVSTSAIDPALVKSAGLQGVAFSLHRDDGGNGVGAVAAKLNVKAYKYAFGGDWASRVKFSEYPVCVLSTPEVPACSTPAPVATTTDAATSTLTATVSVDSDPTGCRRTRAAPSPPRLLASATAAGAAGDFSASTLSPSWKWGTSGNSGAFTYDYNVPTPPSTGGDAPAVDLNYNSQAVDAQTDKSNGQASWVGNGWDMNPGFIERQLTSCATVSPFYSSDMCAPAIDDYTLSLPGESAEIVVNPTTKVMRLRNDPGWSITLVTDSSVPATYSQHWLLIDPKGTQYYFGEELEHGSNVATYAQLSEPVFAATGPCHTSTASTSWCRQQWRWMLDRVVDRNGNETTLFWTKEKNYYRSDAAGAIEVYDANAVIQRIEYGFQTGSETGVAPARVVFFSGYRCNKDKSGNAAPPNLDCAAPAPGAASAADYPDVPTDQICTATSCSNHAPTFFTTRYLNQIVTYYYNAAVAPAGYRHVTVIDLGYTFPATNGAGVIKMWLSTVTRSGENGPGGSSGAGSNIVTLPTVHFAGVEKANNVNMGTPSDVMQVFRVGRVDNETGGQLVLDYTTPDACSSAYVTSIANGNDLNDHDCFPVNDGSGWDWYNKYLVTTVTQRDTTDAGAPDIVTSYQFKGATAGAHGGYAAWHHDDDVLAPGGVQGWADWRGYTQVTATTGGANSDTGTQTKTVTTYYRGMDGDKLVSGARSVMLPDSQGSTHDANALAGQVREVQNYDGLTELSGTLTTYLFQTTTVNGPKGNSFLEHDAVMVRPTSTVTRTTRISGGTPSFKWRTHTINDAYFPAADSAGNILPTGGLVQLEHDTGDSITGAGEACKVYTYQTNTAPTKWLIDFPQSVETRTGGCTGTVGVDYTVVALTDYAYDSFGVGGGNTDGNANAVRVSRLNTTDYNRTNYSFDSYGRVTAQRSPQGYADGGQGLTTIGYADPSSSNYLARVHTTKPSGESTWEDREPGYGAVVAFTDPRTLISTGDYDDLGRLIAVWTPNNTKPASGGHATTKYVYTVGQTWASNVETDQQRTAGSPAYISSWTYYDGLGRVTQVQTPTPDPAGGKIVVDTRFDDQGKPWRVTGPTWYTGAPGSTHTTVNPAQVPSATYTGYDALGRPSQTTLKSMGLVVHDLDGNAHASTTSYYGDHSTTVPAAGSPTATYIDANSRTTQVSQANGTSTVVTNYQWNWAGKLTSMTRNATGAGSTAQPGKPATSTFGYDLAGDQTSASLPDSGTSTTAYDHDGNAAHVTDANGDQLYTSYDYDDRRTALHQGSATGTVLASWSFYTSPTYKGLPSQQMSLGDSAPGTTKTTYTTTDDDYDLLGNVTQATTTVAGTGPLTGSYVNSSTTNEMGQATSTTYPTGGGFGPETINYSYDGTGRILSAASSSYTYLQNATYNAIGQLQDRVLGSTTATVPLAVYDRHVDMTASDQTVKEVSTSVGATSTGTKVQDDVYAWDAGGNLTSVQDKTPATAQLQCYRYDGLNRLVHAYTATASDCTVDHANNPTSAPAYDLTYKYDGASAITSVQDAMKSGGTSTYGYGLPGQPGAVTSVTGNLLPGLAATDTPLAASYAYDQAGQMTKAGADILVYNSRHELISYTKGTTVTKFDYDADGNRIAKLLSNTGNTDTTSTLYVGGEEITQTSTAGVVAASLNRYYTAGGTTIAERSGTASPGTVSWVLSDQQGSTSLVINAATTGTGAGTVTRQRFLPYGALRVKKSTPPPPTDHAYLGKPLDDTGLLSDGARYYYPALGVFTSPDPLTSPASTPSVGGYVYSAANPTTYSDATGLCWGFCSIAHAFKAAAMATADFGVGFGEGVVNGAVSTVTFGQVNAGLNACPFASTSGGCAAGQVVGQIAVQLRSPSSPAGKSPTQPQSPPKLKKQPTPGSPWPEAPKRSAQNPVWKRRRPGRLKKPPARTPGVVWSV